MLWFFSLFIFLFVLGEGGQGAAPGGTPTGAAAVGGPQEAAPGQPRHPGNKKNCTVFNLTKYLFAARYQLIRVLILYFV